MKIFKYVDFLNEEKSHLKKIPSYEECVEICSQPDASFYESKLMVDGYQVSLFNYRLAMYKDFITPIPSKPEISGKELRGLTFVFDRDGTLFRRYVLLEKFFNLNQAPESIYSVVKDYKIMQINNKEDGSIGSFIELPNGKIVGKSKMGFDNDQANGINRIYKTNKDIKRFVDWTLDSDIIAIFEYVSASNRIVLRYDKEELILLRLRDNKTGEHLNIIDYMDKLGSIRIAPFEDENSLDDLIERAKTETGKEGWIITFENGQMIKIKTSEYQLLHGLITDDIHKENIIIDLILNDKIDDMLGQIPEDQTEAHVRINKIISIIKNKLSKKSIEIDNAYKIFLNMNQNRKDYALKYRKDPNFGYVMAMSKGIDSYELAKDWIRDNTKRLLMAREFLRKEDPTLFFQDVPTD